MNTEVVNAKINQQTLIQIQMIVKVIIEIFLEIAYPTNIHPQQQYNRYGNTNQYNIHEHN